MQAKVKLLVRFDGILCHNSTTQNAILDYGNTTHALAKPLTQASYFRHALLSVSC